MMFENPSSMCHTLHKELEGVKSWTWPIQDTGAWLGPSQEFVSIRESIKGSGLRGTKLIVQAGGCCGMYPKLFAQMFDKVVTFEPAPINWFCLTQNCTEQHIIKYNAALGDVETDILLSIADYSNVGTNTVVQEPSSKTILVPQIMLDSLNLDACDAIQFDLEGYEFPALIGAAETISRFRPIISLETKCRTDDAHMLLQAWGYQISGETMFDTQFSPTHVP